MAEFWQDFMKFFDNPYAKVLVTMVITVLAAFIVDYIVKKVLMRLTQRTKTTLDDNIVNIVRKPLFYSFILAGCALSVTYTKIPAPGPYIINGIIKTFAVLIWSRAIWRISSIFLSMVSTMKNKVQIVQPRTQPIFEIIIKILVVGSALYLLLLSWNVNVTGWLASAGVLGIAIGFAAKDTLANFFSGIFILADAPYKLGDYVVLGAGERGRITNIGIRSTRVLTNDDIEIIIPNAVIANGKIMNESGGPYEKERIRVKVSVAYGSDIDRVKEIMLKEMQAEELILEFPEPRVRFRTFGDSGLNIELLGWIALP